MVSPGYTDFFSDIFPPFPWDSLGSHWGFGARLKPTFGVALSSREKSPFNTIGRVRHVCVDSKTSLLGFRG